jgi:hypothetical protein
MYALIISTNRRNKEPKKDQEKTKKQIQRNKTKPGAKNHKTQKITKGGEPGGPVLGRLLCTVFVRVWLIACFFIHHWVAVYEKSVCDLIIVRGDWRE